MIHVDEGTARGRLLRALLAGTASAAVAIGGVTALATPANAAPKGTPALSKQVGLSDGDTVTLTLTNYPTGEIKVAQCEVGQTSSLAPIACLDGTTVTVPEKDGTPGRGDATVTITVAKVFTTGGATPVSSDCDVQWCGIKTSAVDTAMPNAADADVRALPISFRTPALSYAAPGGVSKFADSSVTVTGTGFRTGSLMRVFQCKGTAASQSACDSSYFVSSLAADAAGNLALPGDGILKVRPVIKVGGLDYDCTAVGNVCSIQTSSQTAGADSTQQSVAALSFDAPSLQVSKVSGLVYEGQSLTVTGKNFTPSTSLLISECDILAPGAASGNGCNKIPGEYEVVTTDSSGAFSTSMAVKGTFETLTDIIDCNAAGSQCALQSINSSNFSDRSQDSTVTISFAAPVPPVKTPTLALSPGKVKLGDTITVTGTNFPRTKETLALSVCGLPVDAYKTCNMVTPTPAKAFKWVKYDGSGAFTTTLTIGALKFVTTNGMVDCTKQRCGITTAAQVNHSDRTFDSTAAFTVDTDAPVAKAPGKAAVTSVKVKKNGKVVLRWSKAKANGTPVTTYVVKVKQGKKAWKTAGKVGASTTKLVWTTAKPGTYKARVIATSAAGSSTSKVIKFKIST